MQLRNNVKANLTQIVRFYDIVWVDTCALVRSDGDFKGKPCLEKLLTNAEPQSISSSQLHAVYDFYKIFFELAKTGKMMINA